MWRLFRREEYIMKKLTALLLGILFILPISGCSNQKENASSAVKSSNSVKNQSTTEAESSYEVNNQNYDTVAISDKIIEVNPTEIDTASIMSERYQGRQTYYSQLIPMCFFGNKIYVIDEYYTRSENVQYDEEYSDKNIIYSFDITSDDIEKVMTYEMNIAYSPHFMYNNFYFAFPCLYTDNGLQINCVVADTGSCKQNIVYSEIVTSPYYYADYLNEDEIVFLIFPNINETSYQRVVKYNLKSGDTETIFEREYVPSDNENEQPDSVWTFDTYENEIYLLCTKLSDGNRSWSIIKIDGSGNQIDSYELDGLTDYSDKECSVNQFTVTESQYLLQYYNPVDNSIFVAISRSDVSIATKFDKLVPCTLVSPYLIEERFLLFNEAPDYSDYDCSTYSGDICVYDTVDNKFYFLKTNYDSAYHINSIYANEKGDVLLYLTDSEREKFKFAIVFDITSYI